MTTYTLQGHRKNKGDLFNHSKSKVNTPQKLDNLHRLHTSVWKCLEYSMFASLCLTSIAMLEEMTKLTQDYCSQCFSTVLGFCRKMETLDALSTMMILTETLVGQLGKDI